MPFKLHTYRRHEIPPLLAAQLRSYTRIQWPGLNTDTTLWPKMPEPNPSYHFLLTDGDLLVSHASTRTRLITHNNTPYRITGLSTVFTYPDYRGQGLGEQIIRAATDDIHFTGNSDLAMLFCGDRVKPLYERLGWTHLPTARIAYGDPPTLKTDNHIMAIFISTRAHAARSIFESEIIHVGPSTW